MQENKMNIVLAVVICLALIGVLIFISKKNKVNMPSNNDENSVVNNQVNNSDTSGDMAKAGDFVSMNYTGRLENGTVFDSNIDPKFGHPGQPLEFTLGAGQMIPGFDKGVLGMKVGEKKTLTLPPEEAYGAAGRPPVIPANATLIFDVELLAIKK
jgi:FKBP-type peptidyl-prolyl cis-trans isomerase